MTRNRSNRGRHRRGRGRAQEAVAPEQQVEATAAAPAPEAPAPPTQPAPRPHRTGPSAEDRPVDGQRPARASQRDGHASRGGQSRGRRRGQRRSQLTVLPGDVLKPNAPHSRAPEPPATHTLEHISAGGEPVFGCPMLTRTRIGLPVTGGNPAPRCSLGWALHSESEAAYCLETPDLVQCWKAHPERLDEIRARLGEAVTAAD